MPRLITPVERWKREVRHYMRLICQQNGLTYPENIKIPSIYFRGTTDPNDTIGVAYLVLDQAGLLDPAKR